MGHQHLVGLGVRIGIVGMGCQRHHHGAEGEERQQAHERIPKRQTLSMPSRERGVRLWQMLGQKNLAPEWMWTEAGPIAQTQRSL